MVEKIVDGQGNTQYRYSKCPACGSKKRHFEEQCEKAIKMDVAPVDFIMAYEHDVRPIAEAQTFKGKPLGTEFPTIMVATDICKDCGCVYAVIVITGKDTKQTQTSTSKLDKLWKPGDAL